MVFFGSEGKKGCRCLRDMLDTVYLFFYMCSAFLVLPITMTQRSLSVHCFRSLVRLPPYEKCEDIICWLLYFCFKDRVIGQKRQEGQNEAQKACATQFLRLLMATPCDFLAMA